MAAFRIRVLSVSLASLVLASCSGEHIPLEKLAPVSGTVNVAGKPAAGVLVSFHPLGKQGAVLEKGKIGTATSDSEGRFDVRTYQPGDGLQPGEYVVTVQWPEPPPPGATPDQTGKDRLGERFREVSQPLTKVTIQDGANQLEPFRIDE